MKTLTDVQTVFENGCDQSCIHFNSLGCSVFEDRLNPNQCPGLRGESDLIEDDGFITLHPRLDDGCN